MKVEKLKKLSIENLGLFLKLIRNDYGVLTNKEYARRIKEEFNVECEEIDIIKYETLHIELEDYEKLSRMGEFNLEHYVE